ncbi:MAG: thiamine pyrophosphate-dependent dehydrogenase E1 component subunit alpha, partial [Proteobacteria bacterium]|nr:thiamine pyrophosphate-dependent dehydrogenase E1 component subunit alpha [Pseudomonadota bacterium]
LGSAPIVAGTISLAVGAALASWIRGDGRVTVSFFGDGATGEGVLCESLNFAALKRLPLIFACENNLYSTHLPIREIRVNDEIYRIAEPFGVRTRRVDGNDAVKVYGQVRSAVQACRAGEGPVFLEFRTYRQHGHVGPDDNIQGVHTDIRPSDEIARWRKKDPIERLERRLLREGVATRGEIEELRGAVQTEIDAAHRSALSAPYPAQEELEDHVFATTARL